MGERDLFGTRAEYAVGAKAEQDGDPRLREAERRQVQLIPRCLDDLLPEDHRARAIWDVVGTLDLSRFYAAVAARGSQPGRPATDPKILVALWLYATSEGIGHARELARLCERDDAYRWICGGVSVNHHALSDFRVGNGEALDDLMTQVLAVLYKANIVRLKRVAQDGTRLRASAGAASFRRAKTLGECLASARAQVEGLKGEAEHADAQRTAKQQVAALRAAREREQRVRQALKELPKAEAVKRGRGKAKVCEARVSTTDPEARVMKMGDGGFRPAYNVQFAADVEGRAIVGVAVTTNGTDKGQIAPMLEQIERRTGQLPETYLADGGFAKVGDIEAMHEKGITAYIPVPQPRNKEIDPHEPKADDGPGTAAWRERMATDESKEEYKARAASIETVNADLKTWRGLGQLVVRGTKKVLSVALWAAVTYNVLRLLAAANGA